MTAADALRWLRRYRPFVVAVAAVMLVALVLPLRDRGRDESTRVGSTAGAERGEQEPTVDGDATQAASGRIDAAGGAARGQASVGADGRPVGSSSLSGGRLRKNGTVKNCDPETARIRFPSVYSPPCVDTYDGNGGATSQGVTATAIKVAVYLPQLAGGAAAIYVASGGDPDSIDPETQKQVYEGYRKMFSQHYETYGRKVEFVFIEASGSNTDIQAAKADAIKVAVTHKAFASIFGPAGALSYASELAARGVLCFNCTGGVAAEFAAAREPYLWTTNPGWSTGAVHIGEFIGKSLWGRPARWAGAPTMKANTRKWALVYYEIPEKAYKDGSDRLDAVLATYGARMADHIPYPFDLSTAQAQARTIIARLKDKDITTVLMGTDWAYPVFFTQEATKQQYQPEWFASGASVTTLFSRSYDQEQWSRAFGLNIVPVHRDLTDPVRLWQWQFGSEVPAPCCYWNLWPFFTGIHMAGPVLTPATFRDGMFAYPPSGGRASGQLSSNQIGYGDRLFPFVDYNGIDDFDLAYWDPAAVGADEAGNQGAGMWRHLNNAKHYLPGEYPTTEPRFFDPNGTVTQFTSWPHGEAPRDYPPPSR